MNSAVPWSQRFFLENFLRAKPSREGAKTSRGSLSLTLRKNFKRTPWTRELAPYGTVNFVTRGISHWERRTKTFIVQIDESNLRLQRAWELCSDHFFLLRFFFLRSFQLIFKRNLHDYFALFIAALYHPLSKTNPES